MNEIRLDRVEDAIAAIAAGRPVIVADDADRENEGDIVFAAEDATPELMAFTIRHTGGYVCVAMPSDTADRLDLPPAHHTNQDYKGTAFAVSVDARKGVTTGISAADRAQTVRVLGDPETLATDLNRPGHVVPLRAKDGGVLVRRGHTEAAVDLTRLAGKQPVGAISEMMNDDGTMMRLPELREFADEHGLVLITVADLAEWRQRNEVHVKRLAEARLPLEAGQFTAVGYRAVHDGNEHVALVKGDIGDGMDVLVRVHSECLTGDAFGSLRCDCGPQLQAALRAVEAEGRGVVLYMRGHEGRGIGLVHKLQAYQLQDQGRDTVDANLELGLPADARDWAIGAQILADLGIKSMRLLTNNPDKRAGIEGHGLEVIDRVALPTYATPDNLAYLTTKRDRMGHLLADLPAPALPAQPELAKDAA
ncbi:bifunctional 3,4-dihydroxy-2-butanone-4-phosphate synthase/GTP cyclohydrolase II [Glycomyces sp. TRM65418]|uniref:bifunctional 3,4-dihydroxy-2-butanone-4-phosphate synthase/GTP cyclohydrolase II n=1 Tax=Glycomyces sp. TRM65418 TaxID=2867006 RepID=UPI001CE63A4C|nr:bifunctional 3,4-dihydroxy-2-butanone-4-phosphate synthase/GTP cyclohydrolase II [Glycomyces sp. TRM65418]MCC3764422.1 bifunctional 3,4-dihydroxy-2-butanone-4-phosphate synthase/GTP cyclohydrolase II [Glycomyces sp. TRM65418]QZD54097.1 bifunctional 3,4-dihydroxy-2-butanone-4-phosphate synthase/GTP cyclohydrolase II [Glycomyces sp. TRM65418]